MLHISRSAISAMSVGGHLRRSCMISADGSLSPVASVPGECWSRKRWAGSHVAFHAQRKLVALQHHRHLSYRCHVRTCNATHVRVVDRSHLGPRGCVHDGPGGRTRRRPRPSRISRQPRCNFCRRFKLASAGRTGSITRSLGPKKRRRASDLHA